MIGRSPTPTSAVHDETKRSENQYGREYSQSTLGDLGLAKSATTTKKTKKSKKGKKK